MTKVTKILSIVLLVLSVIYLITRLQSYSHMREAQALSNSSAYVNRFEHIEGLHYFLIGHSLVCVFISIFAFITVRKNIVIDRR